VKTLTLATFRGLGQVMLQNHAGTGLLFAIGIALNSPGMALAAVLGSLLGALIARWLRASESDIREGLYGFNGVLIALAVSLFDLSCIPLLAGGLGLILSVLLFRELKRRGIPAFTSPFVVITWGIFALLPVAGIHPRPEARPIFLGGELLLIEGIPQGFGQVMFQGDIWTEFLFIAGVFWSSRVAAIWGLIGSSEAILTGLLFGWPRETLLMGIYGFNAVLTGIALGNSFRDWVIPVAGIGLAILIMKLMLLGQLPTLTAPFILATWAMIGVRNWRAAH